MHQNAAVMKSLLYIFIGGGTGKRASLPAPLPFQRQTGTAFPWGTFAVNFLGCILIGVFIRSPRIHIAMGTCAHYRTLRRVHHFLCFPTMKAFNY